MDDTMKRSNNNGMISSAKKYIRLKRYQFEVTFCPYVLTPREKLVFNTILLTIFFLFNMFITLYLPLQIDFIVARARPYFLGDQPTRTMRVSVLEDMHL